jgi:recombinational DNA repair ATPase RecF
MRLLELEIHNVRGIRDLLLKPDGKNFLVWGPNGSGKSAVVDAIDFLLTGRVSRLTGKGTGDIKLSEHGPHIDHKPEEATVRAIVRVPGAADPVEIARCMGDPSALKAQGSAAPLLEPILTLAGRGQHVLTRREILKYITADAGTRAQQIQELLNIGEIEEIRKALVNVRNDLGKDSQAAERAVDTAKAAVNATIHQQTYSTKGVLQAINENRAALGGQPIADIASAQLKAGLTAPTVVSAGRPVNVTLFDRDVQYLASVTSPKSQAQTATKDKELRALIAKIRSDTTFLRVLSRMDLTKQGMALIDEAGSCPLCDTPWPPGRLRQYLQDRLSAEETASRHHQRLTDLVTALTGSANNVIATLQKVKAAVTLAGLKDDIPPLQSWLVSLEQHLSALAAPIEKYPDARFGSEQVARMFAPTNAAQLLEHIRSAVKAKYPQATPEQTAWDALTALHENLKALEGAQAERQRAQLFHRRAATLLRSFLEARDTVLGALYKEVMERFVELYRQLHGPDEEDFTATLKPEGAGLDFEVDFYGRGAHPPHALHSEGHQDSMGLCLYLSLAERLSEGLIHLTILDDVVMSVDAEHRRQLCHLLATSFPDRQFFITTHDKTWANQLKTESVVNSPRVHEFYNWNIDTGPRVNDAVEMWDRIEEDLQKNEVPAAAARLRRGLEQFFAEACDSLQAEVTFKLDGRWELGHFLPAAMRRLRSLTKQAKSAANSWANADRLDMLQDFDSTIGQIYARSNAEQWSVNPNVHYCSWTNFCDKDFRPVVEAFQDLCGLFVCGNCGTLKRVVTADTAPAGLACNCGKVAWTLIEKPKSA